jgi:hypothetical protein
MTTPIEPVPVRIENVAEFQQRQGSRAKLHKDVTFRTIVLTALNPVRPLMAADLSREYAQVEAFTNDVVLCETQSKAQDPANQVAGLPNPEGALLKASCTAAQPTLAFPPRKLETTDLVWVTAASFPAVVVVTLINFVEG